jgi:hypothetical protein
VNMVGKGLRVVGYWSNQTGCSSSPLRAQHNSTLLASSLAFAHSKALVSLSDT